MSDAHANFAYSTIAVAPSPKATGTSLDVQSGDGSKFPTPPFNATVWPALTQPTSKNAEIVRVTNISTDSFTITRVQEGSNPRTITVGDQIAATVTAKTLVDAENPLVTWAPFLQSSGSATTFQTLLTATSQTGTASVFVFPVTIPIHLQFNQVILPVSLSYITSNPNTTQKYSHYSYFGLYSMNQSTALSLIVSNSFSMAESLKSASVTFNFPTVTNTSGYGYGTFYMSSTGPISSYISGTRGVGLQFGSNIYLTPDIYYMGVLYLRSTHSDNTTNSFGLSHGGIMGNVLNALNIPGSVSGPLPIGSAGSQWTTMAANSTGWWGRHMVAFITATSITNQAGTAIPTSIDLSALGGVAAGSTATVIPGVTFVST